MSKAMTASQIIEIHKLYAVCGVKSQVAKQLGISASTVSKYLAMDNKVEPEIEAIPFEGVVPINISPLFSTVLNWGELVALSEDEINGVIELQKEIAL